MIELQRSKNNIFINNILFLKLTQIVSLLLTRLFIVT